MKAATPRHLADLSNDIESVSGAVSNSAAVDRACAGVDSAIHLAAVSGTDVVYSKPETVLEVGIKGMLNVIDAAIHHDVAELVSKLRTGLPRAIHRPAARARLVE